MWDKFSSKKPNAPQGEVAEEYSNEPDTQVQPVSTQLRQGNDLNREKQQHKHSYRQGDNPMAMEDQQAAARLEKELMEELSALKVVSEKYMTELSSNTLSSYGKKAEKSNDKNLNKAAGHTKQATDLYAKGTASAVAKSFDHEDKANNLHNKVNKRGAGMDRAAGKLKKQMSKGMMEMAGIEGMTEKIIGQPKIDNMDNAGRGVYSGAEKTATTKHRLGSHEYEVTTEQDGDGDLYYFIYVNGKQMFYATNSGVYEDKLGSRISSALLDEHKKATAQMFDSDDEDNEESSFVPDEDSNFKKPNNPNRTGKS